MNKYISCDSSIPLLHIRVMHGINIPKLVEFSFKFINKNCMYVSLTFTIYTFNYNSRIVSTSWRIMFIYNILKYKYKLGMESDLYIHYFFVLYFNYKNRKVDFKF